MEAKINFESRLPSRHVAEGPERAPHRSYSYAMGLADEQIHQPFAGVTSCWNDTAPCNIALMRQAQAAKKGVAAAGGTPREFCTVTAVVVASGGSTDAALHLPAIAHEYEITFDLFDVAEVFKRTPYIADLKPAGRFVAKDLFEAGAVPLLMKTLLDNGFLHGECLTVTGCSMAENLYRVAWNSDQDVVRPADRSLTATSGVVGLRGNLAAVGGPIALLRDGDMISINAEDGNFDVQLNNVDVELEERRAAQPRGAAFESGYLWKYAQQVGSARYGAVTHPGGSAEKTCYADI